VTPYTAYREIRLIGRTKYNGWLVYSTTIDAKDENGRDTKFVIPSAYALMVTGKRRVWL